VVAAVVDPTTGQLATEACPYTTTELFVERFVPREVCQQHSGFWGEPVAQPGDPYGRRHGGLRGWLDRVFGSNDANAGGDGGGGDDGDGDDEDPQPPQPPQPPV
jgi:hypothetical protein